MNTRDSVKWEVIFCHFEITVDNWHFNVAPFTKQWTHLKPHEAFCQVIYHINPQAKPTFPPRKSWLNPSFQVSYFYRLKNPPFFILKCLFLAAFGSFKTQRYQFYPSYMWFISSRRQVGNFICDWCPGTALGRLSFIAHSIGASVATGGWYCFEGDDMGG